jgi:hypothetical protein
MPEAITYPFTQQQIEAQARGNVTVLILGSIAYAKEQGHDGRHWATFMGQAVASSWSDVTTPGEAAMAIALNCASFGMQIVSVGGDETHGEAVTSDWPGAEALTFFGLSQAEADEDWALLAPVAQLLGLHYAWRREGDELHFTFSR